MVAIDTQLVRALTSDPAIVPGRICEQPMTLS